MSSETDLATLQSEMYWRLTSDAFLAHVSILQRTIGIADSDIAAKLGASNVRQGKIGAVVIVMMPFVDCPLTESAGPQLDILPVVRIITQPQINLGAGGSGLTAEVIAFRAIRLFHLWRCDLASMTVQCDPRVMRPAPVKDTKTVAYDMYFRGRAVLDANAVAAPKFTLSAGSLQMGCNTHAASIWYTTDGSYPIPDAGTATLYAAPFSPPAQTLVRAGGYKADMIPSNVARLWIS